MNRLAMSRAASALLRALTGRAGIPDDRILLTETRSTDWQSLTFIGERHHFGLRVTGPDAQAAVGRLSGGLEEAELNIPGQIVADVAVMECSEPASDGSICITIEALTVAE